MTLADIVAVMSGPDRVRITKGNNELFAGYLGNLVHMAEYEALMAEEVTRIKETVDITHKRYKELAIWDLSTISTHGERMQTETRQSH